MSKAEVTIERKKREKKNTKLMRDCLKKKNGWSDKELDRQVDAKEKNLGFFINKYVALLIIAKDNDCMPENYQKTVK